MRSNTRHETARVRQLLKDSPAAHFKEFSAAWPGACLKPQAQMKPAEVQEADVVDLATTVAALPELDGKAVFIDGALPGERVRFRVLQASPPDG